MNRFLELEAKHLFKWQTRCIGNGWVKNPANLKYTKLLCRCENTLTLHHITQCKEHKFTRDAIGTEVEDMDWVDNILLM